MTLAWWVDRPFLSIVCIGSIPRMINFFLCEKGSKVFDLSIVWRRESPGDKCYEVGDVDEKVLPPGLHSYVTM